jgi:hypothetical protein
MTDLHESRAAPAADTRDAAPLGREPLVPGPLVRARALIEAMRGLSPAEWDGAAQRSRALESAAHRAAVRRLGAALVGHPQSRALDACSRAACAAARRAGDGAVPRGLGADAVCDHAGRVAAHAVLALALAPDLPRRDVALLTAPFDGIVRAR